MPDIACVNGLFTPLEEATVLVNDRGFLFGDGVYEAIRSAPDGRGTAEGGDIDSWREEDAGNL